MQYFCLKKFALFNFYINILSSKSKCWQIAHKKAATLPVYDHSLANHS